MSDIVEFRHLEYLVAIAERRNFSKAAEHVLRSQPAVSHQIKMVEADIGYPLLIRDGRNGVHPTAAGEFVLAWARAVLAQKIETFRIAKAIHDGTVPPLRVGFSSFVNGFLLDNFRVLYQDMFQTARFSYSAEIRSIFSNALRVELSTALSFPCLSTKNYGLSVRSHTHHSSSVCVPTIP